MSSSRRKQMNPRSMKSSSPAPPLSLRSTRSSTKLSIERHTSKDDVSENQDDIDIDDEDIDVVDMTGDGKKNGETPTSTSYNDGEEGQLSDVEQDDTGLLDMTGEDGDLSEVADPLALPSNNGGHTKHIGASSGSGGNEAAGNGSNDSSPFECHICHRKFKHRRSKSRHVMYHTGQKRHFCRYCNASFYRSDHLKAHTRTHTMPGILDGTGTIDERQHHQQQQQVTNRVLLTKNGRLLPTPKRSFDADAGVVQEETADGDGDLGPPTKLHKSDGDESSVVMDASMGGRRSVSSEQNSNFADLYSINDNNRNSHDARHSMSTPLFYSSQNDNDMHEEAGLSSTTRSMIAASSCLNNNQRPSADFGSGSDSAGETAGHRKCPFCQSSFASADQLRRHLREENCTLHPDAGLQHHEFPSSVHASSRSGLKQEASQPAPTAFAMPEPVSTRSGVQQFSCPLCPSGQQQQFSQATMLIMHLTYEHRFSQENLIAAVQQQTNGNRLEVPESSGSSNSTGNKSSAESIFQFAQGLPSFVCQCCDLSTANLAKFHQHMFSAHLKFFYRCSLCSFSAPESEALAKHFLGSHCKVVVSPSPGQQNAGGVIDYSAGKQPVNRPSGGVPANSVAKSSSGSSVPSISDQRLSLVCPICSLACTSRDLFLAHMVTGHSWVRCSLCPEVFTNDRALQKHTESEHRTVNRGNNTLLQNNKSQTSTAASHHHPSYHSDSVIQCLACSRTFRGRLAMKQHLIQFHHFDHVTKSFMFAEEAFFVCDICPDVFRTANVLAEHNQSAHPHLVTSSNGSSSSSFAARRPSSNVSSSNAVLSCNFCGDSFPVAIDLEKHMVEKHPEDLLKSTSKVVNAIVHQHQQSSPVSIAPRKQVPVPALVGASSAKTPASTKTSGTIRCEQCSSVFESQYALEMHMFDEHLMAFAKTSAPVSEAEGAESSAGPSGQLSSSLAHEMETEESSKATANSEAPSPSAASSMAPKRFQCSICDKIFADLPSLAQHRIREHAVATPSSASKPMRCSLCRINLASLSEYLKHADTHHKGSTNLNRTYYACCLCNEYLRDVSDLTNHAVRAHFPEVLTCVVCDSPLPDISAARSVRLPGSAELVYCCSDCYEVDTDLRRCNLCNAVFDTVDNLRWHNAKYHSDSQNVENSKISGNQVKSVSFNKVTSKAGNSGVVSSNPNRTGKTVVGSMGSVNSISSRRTEPASPATSSSNNNSYVLPVPVNLQCSLCETLCKSEEALALHFIEHSYPDGNYQCPICADEEDGRSFESAASLEEHVRSVHGTNAVGSSTCLCTECNRAFLWPAELNHHVAQHDLELLLSQPVPGTAQTKAATAALQAAVSSVSPQVFSCNVCQRSFPTVRSLANHQRQCLSRNRANTEAVPRNITAAGQREKNGSSENGEDNVDQAEDRLPNQTDASEFLRCFICKNKFANAQSLQKHARSIHGVESAEFWCFLCDSKLVNYKQLLHHLSSIHDVNIAQSICELCGDSFTMLKNLKRHLKRVHGTLWQATSSSVSSMSCASQHMAALNSALAVADSPSVGTSEESPDVVDVAVVDD